METDGNVISATLVEANDYQDDDDETYYEEKWGNHVLQQQWVTLTASMWPEPTASPRGWTWRVPTERLPLLAAIFCGAALVVCVLFAFVVYRCCIMPRREKHYCLRKVDGASPPNSTQMPPVVSPAYPNQTAVYAEQKNFGWGYTNRLIAQNTSSGGHWLYNSQFIGGPQCTQCPGTCPVPRSCSNPGPSAQVSVNNTTAKRQRPFSQPGPASVHLNGEIIPKEVPILEISEFSPSHQQHAQYASSSVLDEVSAKEDTSGEPTLKTRSLPAWVRSKPRPLSTEDDLNDLYAKVNFSKKRKNRMRNDEAAIIALSKSRSQFLHKDTDSLVDNEAVIVYDERTAL